MRFVYIIRLSLMFTFLCNYICVSAQISYGGQPRSFSVFDSTSKSIKSLNNIVGSCKINDLDMEEVLNELEDLNSSCKNCSNNFYYGKEVDVNVDFFKSAQALNISDEENLWLLKFESEKAEGYQLIFSKFWLPPNGKLFIYNEDKTMILGSFTSENNREDSTFITQYINGNSVYLEYNSSDNSEECRIHIDKMVYIFDSCFSHSKGPFSEEGAAECHINTSCPEGSGLDVEIKSTVMILEKAGKNYWGVCSGVLVNDGSDYKYNNYPYLFTANHCYELENGGFSNVYNWVFLFRHEASNCNSDGSDLSNNIASSALGAMVLSRDNNSSSNDFLLLQLRNTVDEISRFNIAFAGYDLNEHFVLPGNFMHPLTCVHHPKGDVKKISISARPAESVGWNKEGDDHWQVTFTKGFKTEPASSGSPLFDYRHRVIGMCHGDDHTITCDSTRERFQSLYGKLSLASKIDPSISSHLPYDESDQYIPQYTPPTPPIPDPPSGTQVYLMIRTYEGPEDDYRARIGANLDVYVQFANASKYFKVGEKIRWRVKINNYPYDSKNYSWDDTEYTTCDTQCTTLLGYNAFTRFFPNTFKFKHVGTYNVEIEISGESSNYKKSVYQRVFSIAVLGAGQNHTECFNLGLEIYQPKKKYALGDKLWVKEKLNIVNSGFSNVATSCYNRHYTTSTPSCRSPKHYFYPANQIASLSFYIDNEMVINEKYDTSEEYSEIIPGFFYIPKDYRSIDLMTPGLHTIRVDVHRGYWPDFVLESPPSCRGLYPTGKLKTDPYYISMDKSFIVANCDGYYKGSSLSSQYLSVERNLLKDIGLGVIDVDSLVLNRGTYHLEAYKKIILGPGTHINEGVTFHAEIVPCSSSTTVPPRQKSLLLNTDVIDEKKNSDVILYPNPTTGVINILSKDVQIKHIELYSLDGKKIKVFDDIESSINISYLPDGIYIFKILLNDRIETIKVFLNKGNSL